VLERVRKPALRPRQAIALGLLQGPTELLPISSSAHTSLLPSLAGWSYSELDDELRKAFEVALHAGAGAALAIHMRGDLIAELARLDRRRVLVIALALAPPAVAGLALGGQIERRLGGPRSIAAGLIGGAAAMALADMRAPRGADGAADGGRAHDDAGLLDGLALGLAQACALAPGVSRNGATLTVARARGFSREAADSLSWHAGLPVILGASALTGKRALRGGAVREARAGLALGALAAFLSTLIAAEVARRARLAARPLLGYSLYRCLLAAVAISRARRTGARR
jgi:undecaprenyl-diphosphatase